MAMVRSENTNVKKSYQNEERSFKILLQNRSVSDCLQYQFSEMQKAGAQTVKMSKNTSGRRWVVSWIPTIYQQMKYFSRPFVASMGKAQVLQPPPRIQPGTSSRKRKKSLHDGENILSSQSQKWQQPYEG